MSIFNKGSRTGNAIKASLIGTACNVTNMVMGFAYRTIFLHYLSSSYLGLNGLFTNILQILSFAELGIAAVISYRFYEPISKDDNQKVGQLINFYKRMYSLVFCVILAAGLAILPVLPLFIKDGTEIPAEVNIYLIYSLFLLQTLSSYVFVYKQTLLSADQRQYILAFLNTAMSLIRYVLQIIALAVTRNFTVTLIINISSVLIMNAMISYWVTIKYKPVFQVKESLSAQEKKAIFNDTKATLCHKVGGTVLNSTDSVILSSFVGLTATGLYSNYLLVISSLSQILGQLLGSFTATLGNAHIEQDRQQKYISYKRLLFLNFWIASVCTICLYNLIDDFIEIWIGRDMLFDRGTVIVLCLQFYFLSARYISTSYTNGCGLFVRDRIRPLFEASINLFVSIYFVQKIGIAGIFLGTITSYLCTVFWREPFLLYKYEFKRNMWDYWKYYTVFFCLTVGMSAALEYALTFVPWGRMNSFIWLVQAITVFLTANCIFCVIFLKNEDFGFYNTLVKQKVLQKLVGCNN